MATFITRRKPKRVAARDEPSLSQDDDDKNTGPVVRRPVTSAPKNKSKLRISFDPADTEEHDGNHPSSSLKRPHRPTTSQSLLSSSTNTPSFPARAVESLASDRPTYSKDHLLELRNSTPTTPKDLSAYTSSAEEEAENLALDVAGKFGASHITSTSAIPSAAEIQEKKDRRVRLAKEQGASEDYIALEDYDSDGEFKPQRMQVGQLLDRHGKEKDTRLVRDDEDIAEGFDDFVEDSGRVTLSRKLKRLQERKEQEARREMVDEAEDSSEEDDSEAERNDAYVAAQVSHGMEGMKRDKIIARPKPPKELAKVPKMSDVFTRLRGSVQALEFEKAKLVKRKADVRRERLEIAGRQEHIQNLLTEAGERFEKLRNEAQGVKGSKTDVGTRLNDNGDDGGAERGLESLTDPLGS